MFHQWEKDTVHEWANRHTQEAYDNMMKVRDQWHIKLTDAGSFKRCRPVLDSLIDARADCSSFPPYWWDIAECCERCVALKSGLGGR